MMARENEQLKLKVKSKAKVELEIQMEMEMEMELEGKMKGNRVKANCCDNKLLTSGAWNSIHSSGSSRTNYKNVQGTTEKRQ